MNEITLDENEMFAINNFLEEAINLKVVEAIYIEAFNDEEKGEIIDVVSIPDYSLSYNKKITGEEKTRIEENEEFAQLQDFTEQYSSLSSRLKFSIENNLSLIMMHKREEFAEKSFASGTIIYDRFGDMKKHQERAKRLVGTYKNILSITNLDKVSGNVQNGVVIEKK